MTTRKHFLAFSSVSLSCTINVAYRLAQRSLELCFGTSFLSQAASVDGWLAQTARFAGIHTIFSPRFVFGYRNRLVLSVEQVFWPRQSRRRLLLCGARRPCLQLQQAVELWACPKSANSASRSCAASAIFCGNNRPQDSLCPSSAAEL